MIARQPTHWMIAAALAAAALGVGLLLRFDPNAADSLFPRCIFLMMTGLYCPGCGLTRMLHALVHGDPAQAIRMNAMVMAMLPALALMAASELRGRSLLPAAVARRLYDARLWLGAVIAFGVLRNLPWMPFAALAPG
ncbi:DUF2752 domain-containing protein [Lysobacter humi (ex Lee et al. 2017)]